MIVGLLSGWAALALPFYWLWPGPDTMEAWGLWLALVIDNVLVVGIVSAAVPLAVLLRDGPVRRFAVGLLLSLAGVGCLLVWGYLYLVFG